METMIKVAIADDHKIFRHGIILSLASQKHITFVIEANNGAELIAAMQQHQPDVVLLDLRMPIKDGIETTKYLSKHFPSLPIIILTMFEDERYVNYLMENGANGYLVKTAEPSEVLKAITEAATKGYYLNTFVNKILLKKTQQKTKAPAALNNSLDITNKEKEVLRYICLECTSQEIAEKINTSVRTVESIKEKLMEKFGVKNIAGLVFFTVKNDIIS